MSRYATHLVSTEERRANRFCKGLKSYIRRLVIAQDLQTYDAVLRCALRIEIDNQRYQQRRAEQGQGKRKTSESSNSKHKKARSDGGQDSKICQECGKRHRGKCLYGTGVCYKCGKQGHLAVNKDQTKPRIKGRSDATTVDRKVTCPTNAPSQRWERKEGTKPSNKEHQQEPMP
ncbi:hypothetical protein CFOL_v3_31729 [Cephalotus follicularis]|uniref:CCHC-type domain-containing protein n=1 Tax=Cephalotus follicularis TaxID=3775 RepID=A0A1Q3D702_CEPFO|nr:hypothetical protein CFOL_v3_31729 [Cephalotus follicularis]